MAFRAALASAGLRLSRAAAAGGTGHVSPTARGAAMLPRLVTKSFTATAVGGFASKAASSSAAAAAVSLSAGAAAAAAIGGAGVARARLALLPAPGSLWAGLRRSKATAAVITNSSGPMREAAAATKEAISPLVAGLPDSARKQISVWLGTASGWVFALVVLGGVTRLTRSGLSMTEWKFAGERPPMNAEDWEVEFSKYRASPEFKQVHSSMTIDEFKFIYWMEYGHRMWARALGILFAVPATYFAARGFINTPLARRLGILFLMGGTQGLVGWWMVRSGLKDPKETDNPQSAPRVSPYRLAGHLASAFVIYTTLVWTTLNVAFPKPMLSAYQTQQSIIAGAAKLRGMAHPLSMLVGVTAISGAFVAGNDAGRAYNTFPTMNGEWIPEEYFEAPSGWLRNCFENTAAVQLHHRVLALATTSSVLAIWLKARNLPLPPPTKACLHILLAGVTAQVSLGIATLLNYVPISLGSAHQAGALGLFTVVVTLMHTLRKPVGRVGAAGPGLMFPVAVASILGVGVAVTQQK